MSKTILVIAPHPDDETMGAGGTMIKYASAGYKIELLTVSGHLPPLYTEDDYATTVQEANFAYQKLGVTNARFLKIPATMVHEEPVHKLNKQIAEVVNEVEPEIVLLPFPDRHIDHKVIFESAMVATRPVKSGKNIKILASYETLSETHWNAAHIEPNFTPNWIIDIFPYFRQKCEALECYQSQITEFPGARSIEAVAALAKFRGTQAGFAYGEAFHIIRMTS